MNKVKLSVILYLPIMLIGNCLNAQPNYKTNSIKWSEVASLPDSPDGRRSKGVAGAFTGVSNNILFIAGGAYFPDKMPWEGGVKTHTNKIHALLKVGNGKFVWLPMSAKLPVPVAYGACTTFNEQIICVGGETEAANSSKSAFMMKWDSAKHQLKITDLPPLPIAIANACLTNIGSKIYLFGGESEGQPSKKAFVLDLSVADKEWAALPDAPIAMSHSVAVCQNSGTRFCIYLIGGRSSSPSGISELHNTVFRFDPVDLQWKSVGYINDGNTITNLSAATAVAVGQHGILVAGGDKGNVFHQIETFNAQIAKAQTVKEKADLQEQKKKLLLNHPGFSKDVLLYNTLTNAWAKVGKLMFASQVTTTAVKWGDEIFIPCGEVKPGIRTPDIVKGDLSSLK